MLGKKSIRAVSTFITILLILVAAIVGGLISYLWAIAPFYATPNNVGLAITGASFQVSHADYFDVNVLNPSNSLGATSIASIFLDVEGQGSVLNVTNSSPNLPIALDQGATATVRCYLNWGNYAGKNMSVTVFPTNGTGASFPVQTQFVGLTSTAFFNANVSVGYFTVIAQNDPSSAINLTINSVSLNSNDITQGVVVVGQQNQSLPVALGIGKSASLLCFTNWEGDSSPDVIVGTQEGYQTETTQNVTASALFEVSDVQFNATNPDRISVMLNGSSLSMASVDVSNITIAYGNTTDVINGTLSSPPFPVHLEINSSVILDCQWNWSDSSYRNMSILVTANTTQGFVSSASTFTTPPQVDARIDQVNFDLNDTQNFSVNVTNPVYSLQNVTVAEVSLNDVATTMTPKLLTPSEQSLVFCAYNWSSFLGQAVQVVARFSYGSNSSFSYTFNVTVPLFAVTNLSFGNSELGNPYVNVTVRTSEFAVAGANITGISVLEGNTTTLIDGTVCFPSIPSKGYILSAGTEVTFVCPWNWSPYVSQSATVTVQTANELQASATSIVQ